jgi:hypothetical protein
MIANTCIESTGRFGMELGYHVTLVKDATTAFSPEAMHAAHAINGPTFAHAIVTTEDFIPNFRPEPAQESVGFQDQLLVLCRAAYLRRCRLGDTD